MPTLEKHPLTWRRRRAWQRRLQLCRAAVATMGVALVAAVVSAAIVVGENSSLGKGGGLGLILVSLWTNVLIELAIATARKFRKPKWTFRPLL